MDKFEKWWSLQSKTPYMTAKEIARNAFYAGYQQCNKEDMEEIKDAHAEGMWQERQGEEYGSY